MLYTRLRMELALRSQEGKLKQGAGLEGASFYFAGETAKQAEIRDVNNRDTWVIVLLTTVVIMLIRIVLVPAIMVKLGKFSLWPQKV
jgi:putative drug exporter of the RND superfamily